MKPVKLQGGAVLPGGLGVSAHKPPTGGFHPGGTVYRALVTATKTREDQDRQTIDVACDLILVASGFSLADVPVVQTAQGLHNASLWVPRAATRTLDGSPLNLTGAWTPAGSFTGTTMTALNNTDGDLVLVSFVEGDRDLPVIVGALPHPQTARVTVAGAGWAEGNAGVERGTPQLQESYQRHGGTEIRINEGGDLLIDTVGATSAPDEAPSNNSGQVRIRVKDSQRFTVELDGEDVFEVWKDGTTVRIDLGEGATEPVVLGEKLKTWLLSHKHPTAMGLSGPPVDPTDVGAVLDDALSSNHRVK